MQNPAFTGGLVDDGTGQIPPFFKIPPTDNYYVDGNAQGTQHIAQTHHLTSPGLDHRFHHQNVQVAIFSGVTPGLGTEENDGRFWSRFRSRVTISWMSSSETMLPT